MHVFLPANLFRHAFSSANREGLMAIRTLVLSRRKMNWKFDFSPDTSDIFAVAGV